MTVNHEGKAILSFEAGTDKLRVVDELKGFAIAGADGHFQWAEAVVAVSYTHLMPRERICWRMR